MSVWSRLEGGGLLARVSICSAGNIGPLRNARARARRRPYLRGGHTGQRAARRRLECVRTVFGLCLGPHRKGEEWPVRLARTLTNGGRP